MKRKDYELELGLVAKAAYDQGIREQSAQCQGDLNLLSNELYLSDSRAQDTREALKKCQALLPRAKPRPKGK